MGGEWKVPMYVIPYQLAGWWEEHYPGDLESGKVVTTKKAAPPVPGKGKTLLEVFKDELDREEEPDA